MKEAIRRAYDKGQITKEALEELPSIPELILGIVVVGSVLTLLGAGATAFAATGVGAVLEGIAAGIVIALAALGIFTSAIQIKDGLVTLLRFFNETRCYKATSSEALDAAGDHFASGIAKAGVGTIMAILSYFGARRGVKMGKAARAKWAIIAQRLEKVKCSRHTQYNDRVREHCKGIC